MTRLKEFYCALCGVPFGVDNDLYRTGSVTEDDVVWTQYYTARKSALYKTGKTRISNSSSSQGGEVRGTLRLVPLRYRSKPRL